MNGRVKNCFNQVQQPYQMLSCWQSFFEPESQAFRLWI
jgi:hypothetical protein